MTDLIAFQAATQPEIYSNQQRVDQLDKAKRHRDQAYSDHSACYQELNNIEPPLDCNISRNEMQRLHLKVPMHQMDHRHPSQPFRPVADYIERLLAVLRADQNCSEVCHSSEAENILTQCDWLATVKAESTFRITSRE